MPAPTAVPPPTRLQFPSARALSDLYAGKPANLDRLETTFGVRLASREDWVELSGPGEAVASARQFFEILQKAALAGRGTVSQADFDHHLRSATEGRAASMLEALDEPLVLRFGKGSVAPKTPNQKRYLHVIRDHDIVFGIGPAGTGKTYLAMASALNALDRDEVKRIVITRPAVEAGEALGFLPGDLREKIDPYLMPLYDAIDDMVGKEGRTRLFEKGKIEIAPLAYMRGRTLQDAFIILDEAQNTTREQMKMFLTRLGQRGRMVITGDTTQIDLRSGRSGLIEAVQLLHGIEGIAVFRFEEHDVVRHPLVRAIIHAYENPLRERSQTARP